MFSCPDLWLTLAENLIFGAAGWVAHQPLALLPLLSILCGSALMWFLSLKA